MKDDLFVNFSEYKLFISENDNKYLVVISFGLRFCKKNDYKYKNNQSEHV